MIQPNQHLLGIHRISERMHERGQYIRLDRNERVTPVSTEIFGDMLSSLSPESFCAYPDPSPLYERLSKHLGLSEDYIYLTNGSDAAIRMAFQTYIRPGDLVAFPDPTYAMYSIYTAIFRAQSRTVAYAPDMTLDISRFLAWLGSKSERPRLLAIPNPDQPTGSTLTERCIQSLATAASDAGAVFIIDEAYFPFYPCTAVPLVREFENIIVTRTFSKVGGLAGLRIGYMVANPSIVNNIQRIRGAHEVNAIALAIGSYVLDHPELSEEYLMEIREGRKVLAATAQELGLGFPPCPTNFQLLRFPGVNGTGKIVSALKEKGYLVKGDFSSPAVRDCIRVTLAGPEVMQGFANRLRDVLSV